jgi:hypothetical protein
VPSRARKIRRSARLTVRSRRRSAPCRKIVMAASQVGHAVAAVRWHLRNALVAPSPSPLRRPPDNRHTPRGHSRRPREWLSRALPAPDIGPQRHTHNTSHHPSPTSRARVRCRAPGRAQFRVSVPWKPRTRRTCSSAAIPSLQAPRPTTPGRATVGSPHAPSAREVGSLP